MTKFKGIVLRGILIKLEKWVDGAKVSECGIDSEKAQSLWGAEQPLRSEYERLVSKGHCPEYILVQEYPEFDEEA